MRDGYFKLILSENKRVEIYTRYGHAYNLAIHLKRSEAWQLLGCIFRVLIVDSAKSAVKKWVSVCNEIRRGEYNA